MLPVGKGSSSGGGVALERVDGSGGASSVKGLEVAEGSVAVELLGLAGTPSGISAEVGEEGEGSGVSG